MERGSRKRAKYIHSDLRSDLRESFENMLLQKMIPLEIWIDIVLKMHVRDMGTLAQCSKAFYRLVEHIKGSNTKIALRYKEAGQVDIARKCFQMCLDNGDPDALFRVGHQHEYGCGWFLERSERNFTQSRHFYGKAAVAGHPGARMLYAKQLSMLAFKAEEYWIPKALESKNAFAIGYYQLMFCYNVKKAMHFFELGSAGDDDDFCQLYLGLCLEYLLKDPEKAQIWYEKASTKGTSKDQKFDAYSFKRKYDF